MHRLLLSAGSIAGAVLAVHGFRQDAPLAFYTGLALFALPPGLRALGPARARLPQALWTLCWTVFCGVGLFFAVEAVWAAIAHLGTGGEPAGPYSYQAARSDPDGFRRWWAHHQAQLRKRKFIVPDPSGRNPFVLAPGVVEPLYDSEVRINSLGFRGREFPRDKGDTYRIVVLGESTTFGLTAHARDRPWPEVLEERIASELACAVPVQVVNAGVPAWTLANQVFRFEDEIVPLAPDLVLTYHGYNGFRPFLPPLGKKLPAPPVLKTRPSRLLSGAEHAVRLWWFRRRHRAARTDPISLLPPTPIETPYANLYRRLAELAARHGIRLVALTFNLAVNRGSPEEAIQFYDELFPGTPVWIDANRYHSRLLTALKLRRVLLVIDTSEGLDGAYRDAYVDLIHFTQLGRDRLARNVLDGLRPLLLATPRPACVPRTQSRGR